MNNKGSIYIIALTVMVSLAALTGAMLSRSYSQVRNSERYSDVSVVLHLAEAAVDQAAANLRNNITDGFGFTDMAGGRYWAEVRSLGGSIYEINAFGDLPNNDRRDLQAIMSVSTPRTFDYAVFAIENVTLDSDATIDSYDSTLPDPYGVNGNTGQNGDVGSNASGAGTISLDSDAVILGDALVGPGGDSDTDIVTDGNSNISGSQQVLAQAETLAPETFPSGAASGGLVLTGTEVATLSGGTYRYTEVNLDSDSSVQVTGNVILYVEQTFKLSSNASFKTEDNCTGCSIVIYVDGADDPNDSSDPAFYLDSNSLLSAGDDPTRLAVFVTDNGGVDMDSDSQMYGGIYAPLSEVYFDSNARLYGAVVGRTISLDSSVKVHFDVALRSQTNISIQRLVSIISWREL